MPHKEIRKIMRAGNSSFAVIIPRAWLRYYNLKYGDCVEVVTNGIVKIRPLKKQISRGNND